MAVHDKQGQVMDGKNRLTTKEASQYLESTPEATLRWWRHQGIGPKSYKLGARRVVYDRADLDAWLDEQKLATAVGGAR